eukprot:gb/GECG01006611.1/.p1 GENE.gb/GECG01006611.1/~~gb/GECG01006611.1/.p1  ORF type:complete len:495 (+),score=24.81 gb/GECG01006611.1/:1-1485(+)
MKSLRRQKGFGSSSSPSSSSRLSPSFIHCTCAVYAAAALGLTLTGLGINYRYFVLPPTTTHTGAGSGKLSCKAILQGPMPSMYPRDQKPADVQLRMGTTGSHVDVHAPRLWTTRQDFPFSSEGKRAIYASYRFPKGCKAFQRHIESRLSSLIRGGDGGRGSKEPQESESFHQESDFKIKVETKLNRHAVVLYIPECGRYVLKFSCRPPTSKWHGRQAWPEIVASVLDREILGYNLTHPTFGIVLPLSTLLYIPAGYEICSFYIGREQVVVGSLTPFVNFEFSDTSWYNERCNQASQIFLCELFRLNLLDYLVLNTDRHMEKNWFREEHRIVAMDNGAWAMHSEQPICNADDYRCTLFEQVKLLQSTASTCYWIKQSSRPICTLVKKIKNSTTVRALVNTSLAAWQSYFQKLLEKDLWFLFAPLLYSGKKTKISGIAMASHTLSRDLSSCGDSLDFAGIGPDTRINATHLSRFIVSEIAKRYFLAQQTIKVCLMS